MAKIFGVDSATGVATFQKPKRGEDAEIVERKSAKITQAQFDRLLELAYRDGFKPDAKSDRGGNAQNTRVVNVYVGMAVDALIAKRIS